MASAEKQPLSYIAKDNVYIFNCPHCLGSIVVQCQDVNCQIFRHAVLKNEGTQVNPHASRQELQVLKNNDLLYGCGGPFRMIKDPEHSVHWSHAVACDYI
jgi:hypothetical protein